MGFFERNLGALGETMDENLDRARDHTKELCNRQGWADRAADLWERVRERCQAHRLVASETWRQLGQDNQRRVLAGGGLAAMLVLVVVVRAFLFQGSAMPSAEDRALVEMLRENTQHTPTFLAPSEEPSGSALPWD